MRTKLSVILLALIFAFAACSQDKSQSEQSGEKANKEEKTGEKTSGDMHTFEAPDGTFEVDFPGNPDKSEEPVNVSGVEVQKHTISYSPTPTENYSLVYMDFPKDQFKGKDPMKVLNAQKDGIVDNLGGRLVEEKDLGNDYPGLMFSAKTGNRYGIYHLYMYKDRLFQLSIISTGSFAEDTSFLESFELHAK